LTIQTDTFISSSFWLTPEMLESAARKAGPHVSRHYIFCGPQTNLIVTTERDWAQN